MGTQHTAPAKIKEQVAYASLGQGKARDHVGRSFRPLAVGTELLNHLFQDREVFPIWASACSYCMVRPVGTDPCPPTTALASHPGV
jgi:hypothetical protein